MMMEYTVQHSLAVEPSYLLPTAGHSKGGGVAVPDGHAEGKPPEWDVREWLEGELRRGGRADGGGRCQT